MSRLLVAVSFLLFSVSALAGTPPAYLHYQGYLTDVEGTPVEGEWTIAFKFYSLSAGGAPFFVESKEVKTEVGVFSAILGGKAENPLDPSAFEGGEAFLELSVGPKGGQGITLQPRQRVVSHPYALWTANAGQCQQADNALSFGGAAPEAFVTLASLPQLCVSPQDLAAQLADLGVTAYGDAEVAAYLEANGYLPGGAASWDELEGKPEGLLTADSAAASGLFLMADGSVVATGALDLGGNELLNVVIQNASAAEAPQAPLPGQLWYDSDENILKVFGADAWVSLGDASDLACEGCVDASDVAFAYAAAAAKGGAALKALSLECTDCVTLGSLAEGVLDAANVSFDDGVAGLGAATVGEAVEALAAGVADADDRLGSAEDRLVTLENNDPGKVNEGAGSIMAHNSLGEVKPNGSLVEYLHLLSPRTPKVFAFIYGLQGAAADAGSSLTVSSRMTPNAYSSGINGTAGQDNLTVGDPGVFSPGAQILLHQTVGTGGDGSGASRWELATVQRVDGSTVRLTRPLKYSYTTDTSAGHSRAQAVIGASYDKVEVVNGGVLAPSVGLDGEASKGGILYVRAAKITVRNGGRIEADGLGFNHAVNNNATQGDSQCNVQPPLASYNPQPNCAGGGAASNASCGGAGGGNRTTGQNGQDTCGGGFGLGGLPQGGDGFLTFGGAGGGAGHTHTAGSSFGGGIIVLGADQIVLEAGAVLTAQGSAGTASNIGGGAGGTIALFANSLVNQATVALNGGGGYNYGGTGGEGWLLTGKPVTGILAETFPKGVQIWVDGQDVTAKVGNPDGKGSPHWDAATSTWGVTGLDAWSTGRLDLSAAANWTLGEHSLELKETGGVGGVLRLYTYLVFPFTEAKSPANDTCALPQELDLSTGSVKISASTEDAMGSTKATDDFVQPLCGGSGGPDLVYKVVLTDWRKLSIKVTAGFQPRVFVRKGDCLNGTPVACGGASLETPDLKTGTYYLFVDSDGNTQKGDFTLEVTATPPAPPANDTCAAPVELTFDSGGKAEVYGVSLFANHDYLGSCGGNGGSDLVYQFTLPAGVSLLDLEVVADFNALLYLAKETCDGTLITCAPKANHTMTYPASGTYFLFVDGKTANDKGEFTLKITYTTD
jgi:hypothetical protein